MCGFVGVMNKNNKLNIPLFKESLELLNHRGPDSDGYFMTDNVMLGHKRLVVIDKSNGNQPMLYDDTVIIYNGELYNTEELRQDLISKGYSFVGHCDTEVLLKMYHYYGENCLDYLNGIYSFVIYEDKKIFAARDRAGVKPLYYYCNDEEIVVASEMKSILKYKSINKVTIRGLQEILAVGPSHTPGVTPYKDVYELKPGHSLKYDKQLKISKYWDLHTEELGLSFQETLDKVKELVTDAIKRQLTSDVPLATFLSGGLDSSIITAVANIDSNTDSYSIDYEHNDKSFESNEFQVSQDSEFIKYMTDKYNLNHHSYLCDLKDLAKELKQSVILKDTPGMADIDSSLYLFSKFVKDKHTVCLSGECADELFAGYPWYSDQYKVNKYPWLRHAENREELLSEKYKDILKLAQYAQKSFNDVVSQCDSNDNEKRLTYINIKSFMSTLLERKDRMTMGASLEVRVPFSDHRIMQLMYNVPYIYKNYGGVEKALLRDAFKDVLPTEIFERKKNPYPKTHSEKYTNIVCDLLSEVLENEDSVLHRLFNTEKLYELIETKGSSYNIPWFGQLMTGPQLIAYLYQFDYWFNEYNIEIVKE